MSGAIWFISAVLEAAMPFLIAALALSAYCGLMLAGRWFIKRGLRRRRERLNGWSKDSSTMTDLEMESLR